MKTLFMAAAMLAAVHSPAAAGGFSYDDYAAVLEARVDDSAGVGYAGVDYAGLKRSPERLRRFTTALAELPRETYEAWDTPDRIAFWINAYNALTLELIVDNYPIKASLLRKLVFPANSIRQIPGAWKGVKFTVMGEEMTLDHIEHQILRREFDEPRIHVALVCAAVSCPPLRREPFRGADLDRQLDDQARRFLARPDVLAVNRKKGVVRLSAIFDWFKDDFVKQYGGGGRDDRATAAVLDFVGRYAGDDVRSYLQSGDVKVEYFDYDWTLNEQEQ
jgi:hypothetical protein